MRVARQAASLFVTARSASRSSGAIAATGARAASTWLQGRPPTINLDAGTVSALYYKAVRNYDLPLRDILVSPQQDAKLTVAEFDHAVTAYAKGFIDGLNLKAGDKIGLWLTNEAESYILQLACALINVTAVNIDASLGYPAVLSIVEKEELRVLVLSPRYKSEMRAEALPKHFAPELEEFETQTGYLPYASKRLRKFKYLVSTGHEPVPGVIRLQDLPVVGGDEGYGDVDEIAALQALSAPADAVSVTYAPDAAAEGGFSSASRVTHSDILRTAGSAVRALSLVSTDTVVVAAQLSHPRAFGAGCVAASQAHAKLVFPSQLFDAAKTLDTLSIQRATVLVATAEQVAALDAALAAAAPGTHDLSALRTGFVVDSAAPAKFAGVTLLPGSGF